MKVSPKLLYLPDAQHVGGHAELVEQVACSSCDSGRSLRARPCPSGAARPRWRARPGSTGAGRSRAPGHDRLAGGLEALDAPRATSRSVGRPGAGEVVQHQQRLGDLAGPWPRRRAPRARRAAASAAGLVAAHAAERGVAQAAAALLDHRAAQVEHEHGLVLQRRRAALARQATRQRDQQRQEQQVEQRAPACASSSRQKPPQRAARDEETRMRTWRVRRATGRQHRRAAATAARPCD